MMRVYIGHVIERGRTKIAYAGTDPVKGWEKTVDYWEQSPAGCATFEIWERNRRVDEYDYCGEVINAGRPPSSSP